MPTSLDVWLGADGAGQFREQTSRAVPAGGHTGFAEDPATVAVRLRESDARQAIRHTTSR
ncbi:hypothetical protein [Nocardia asiatica]|uniref:hypothetical protein n=1 Tax=Nocardia asiatica TaxID=209252 RepID=UPI002458C106|nr:hypothetical protein [Nocardia asiatica]